MALERLQRGARPSVPQLDCLVGRCRHQRLAVRRESYGVDKAQMALKRLQHCIPFFLNPWQPLYPFRNTVCELLSYYTCCWCEYKSTRVRLKRSLLNSWPVVEDKPLCIIDEIRKIRAIT
jgi:hypothetical protein